MLSHHRDLNFHTAIGAFDCGQVARRPRGSCHDCSCQPPAPLPILRRLRSLQLVQYVQSSAPCYCPTGAAPRTEDSAEASSPVVEYWRAIQRLYVVFTMADGEMQKPRSLLSAPKRWLQCARSRRCCWSGLSGNEGVWVLPKAVQGQGTPWSGCLDTRSARKEASRLAACRVE